VASSGGCTFENSLEASRGGDEIEMFPEGGVCCWRVISLPPNALGLCDKMFRDLVFTVT
jgi:hypothetical protein